MTKSDLLGSLKEIQIESPVDIIIKQIKIKDTASILFLAVSQPSNNVFEVLSAPDQSDSQIPETGPPNHDYENIIPEHRKWEQSDNV